MINASSEEKSQPWSILKDTITEGVPTMVDTEGHDHRRDLKHLLHVAAVEKTNLVPP